jgi:hypothetical protein
MIQLGAWIADMVELPPRPPASVYAADPDSMEVLFRYVKDILELAGDRRPAGVADLLAPTYS